MRTAPLDDEVFTREPLKTYLAIAKGLKPVPREPKDVALTSTPSSLQSTGTAAQPPNHDAVAGPLGTSTNLIVWIKVCEK